MHGTQEQQRRAAPGAAHRVKLEREMVAAAMRQRWARVESRLAASGLPEAPAGVDSVDWHHGRRLAAVIRALRVRREMMDAAVRYWRRRLGGDDPRVESCAAITYAAAIRRQ